MLYMWRMHDATGFPPFQWLGNYLEDAFEHEINEVVEESRNGGNQEDE